MEDWIELKHIEVSNPVIKELLTQIHVDTRDFHCSVSAEALPEEVIKNNDFSKMIKYGNRFFFTLEEITEILNRLFTESGGEFDWRYLVFKGEFARETYGWQLKYIRAYKTEHGWILCNSLNFAVKREFWQSEIDVEQTHAHN